MHRSSPLFQCTGAHLLTIRVDNQARHVAYIVSEALQRAENPQKMAIVVSEGAEDAWIDECIKYSLWASPIGLCPPGYYNGEGELLSNDLSPEDQKKRSRSCLYMKGMPAFRDLLDAWKADGKLDGYVLQS